MTQCKYIQGKYVGLVLTFFNHVCFCVWRLNKSVLVGGRKVLGELSSVMYRSELLQQPSGSEPSHLDLCTEQHHWGTLKNSWQIHFPAWWSDGLQPLVGMDKRVRKKKNQYDDCADKLIALSVSELYWMSSKKDKERQWKPSIYLYKTTGNSGVVGQWSDFELEWYVCGKIDVCVVIGGFMGSEWMGIYIY